MGLVAIGVRHDLKEKIVSDPNGNERWLAGWHGEKKLLDERLADPALYASGDNTRLQAFLKRQAELAQSIDEGENRWLEIHTELEEIGEV